jgi:ATP-dependent protease ClpP protease subunit
VNEVSESRAERFELSLAELRKRGWCQGEMENMDGQVCSAGAVILGNIGCGERTLLANDFIVLNQTIHEMTGRVGSIANFNDHPDTTQEMVEQVFEKAILHAYEEEAFGATV